MIRLRPEGNSNKDGGFRDGPKWPVAGFEDEDDEEDENEAPCEVARSVGRDPGGAPLGRWRLTERSTGRTVLAAVRGESETFRGDW
jgi:hypothetical protein